MTIDQVQNLYSQAENLLNSPEEATARILWLWYTSQRKRAANQRGGFRPRIHSCRRVLWAAVVNYL